MNTAKIEPKECSHCQQPIKTLVSGRSEDRNYCCYGCKVVDELINDEGELIDLNTLNLAPYRYLDEPEINEKLIDFNEEGHVCITLHLPDIHCSSCIYLLENLPQVQKGIHRVEVHFSRKEAVINYSSEKLSLSLLAAILDYIGYKPDFQTKLQPRSKARNQLLSKLGVAGFFFGNTMLLALPEYLDHRLAHDAGLQQFFRYLMFGFSLPIVFFSGWDYLRKAWQSLRVAVLSIDLPIALGILVLFGRSSYEVFSGIGPGYFDSLAGLVFFLLIGRWYQQKTYANFSFDRDLSSFLPLAANRILKNGREKAVPVEKLETGDQIILRQGEVLPADAHLLDPIARIDYSYLTGESLPVSKRAGESIYAGARLLGPARFEVINPVAQSYLNSLWSAKDKKERPVLSLTDKVSRYFTPAILLIALAGGIYWFPLDAGKAVNVVTAVLIVACPCALALAEPFTQGSMMRWFGRFGLYLKEAAVLQGLAAINHLIFDKTGTLTRSDELKVRWEGAPLEAKEKAALAALSQRGQHPLAKALYQHLSQQVSVCPALAYADEVTGAGMTGEAGGLHLKIGSALFLEQAESGEESGIHVAVNGSYRGCFRFSQALRPGLKQLFSTLPENLKISLLSGDHAGEQQRFAQLLPAHSHLRFGQSPVDKRNYLKQQQGQGQKVAMVGDGLNDAGALQTAEVGISVCEQQVNFFPASDALLQASAIDKLSSFLMLSQRSLSITKWAFALSFLYNLIGISLALSGWLSPLVAAILMPLSSVSVVLFCSLRSAWLARKSLTSAEAEAINDIAQAPLKGVGINARTPRQKP